MPVAAATGGGVVSGTVAAVVVSYNVRELLLACVASLVAARESGELATIVVVDNASADRSAGAVREAFPDVTVIEAPNDGYGAGANRGIAATNEDYILILNPDTVVPSGTVRRLASVLDSCPEVGLVGPRLRYPSGTVQPTIRRFPERLTPLFESTILHEWWPENRWARRFHAADLPEPEGPTRVEWLVGAALLARREAVEMAGGFDPRFRMYSEEVEWQWRLWRRGWKILHLPEVEIAHHEGASARQDVAARQIAFDTSRARLARLMYGRLTGEVVRSGLLAGHALQLGRESAKWALGHRRELRRRRMRLYLATLRSGLREGREWPR